MSRNLNFTIKPLYLNGKTKIRQISKKKKRSNKYKFENVFNLHANRLSWTQLKHRTKLSETDLVR